MGKTTPGTPERFGEVSALSETGFHRIAYCEWGHARSGKPPVMCLHGLTRQGRDFDYLARCLVGEGRRVLCPDLPGRGRSERLANSRHYVLPQYAADMASMIARAGADEIDWVGTSLGGLTGIMLAGHARSPIRRLVVNDIGPYLPWAGLSRIAGYLDATPKSFASLAEVERYFRDVLAPYGTLTDEHWRHLTIHSVGWVEERQHYVILCDPSIAAAFRNPWLYSLNLWKYWEAIEVPILVIRGSESDLLTKELAREMVERNPRTRLVEFEGRGHAPSLMVPEEIEPIVEFLNT